MSSIRKSIAELLQPVRECPGIGRLVLGFAALIPIYFAVTTGQIWEDFFITYRFSENLARGSGLVYNPGERVHGFTSAINVMVPAFFAWVTHAADFRLPLLLYQLIALTVLYFAGLSLVCLALRSQGGRAGYKVYATFFPVLAFFEIKTTAFSMDGQESAFMVGFLALAFCFIYLDWFRHYKIVGLAFAGLMYTRPDSCVYIAWLCILGLFFREPLRPALMPAIFKSLAICAILYLPWFLFVWAYFGSPIPHTLIAKRGMSDYTNPGFEVLAPLVGMMESLPKRMCGALLGIYDGLGHEPGSWPRWARDAALALEALAVTYWFIPGGDRLGRMFSFVSFGLLLYLAYAGLIAYTSPWYYPPLAFMSIATIWRCSSTFFSPQSRGGWRGVWRFAPVLLLLGMLAFIFIGSIGPLRVKQEVVDGENRRAVAAWLRDHASPTETVFLEPLGYIGYFSQRNMRDWPGLVAPEIVQFRRDLGLKGYSFVATAAHFRPDWIIARPADRLALGLWSEFTKTYGLMQTFDVSDKVALAGVHYGSSINDFDKVFYIYHRR